LIFRTCERTAGRFANLIVSAALTSLSAAAAPVQAAESFYLPHLPKSSRRSFA